LPEALNGKSKEGIGESAMPNLNDSDFHLPYNPALIYEFATKTISLK